MADRDEELERLRREVAALRSRTETGRGSALGGEVRKEVTKRVSQWLVGGALLLAAGSALGWWFYVRPQLAAVIGGVPDRGVVAFDAPECPEGWAPFEEGRGRAIVGAGEGRGLTPRAYRSTGGAERHALTVGELPAHRHDNPIRYAFLYARGPTTRDLSGLPPGAAAEGEESSASLGHSSDEDDHRSRPTGEGAPHPNMPPYIALTLCMRR